MRSTAYMDLDTSTPGRKESGPTGLVSRSRIVQLSRLRTSSGLRTSYLPDLDDIVVRVTHVAANLHAVVLWLGKEFGPSPSPLLVRGPDVGDTNIQEAGNLIRVLRGTKRHVWFIVRWAATDVQNQPTIGNVDDGGFATTNN